jgi:hypothetical protein
MKKETKEKMKKNLFKHHKESCNVNCKDNCNPGILYGLGFIGAVIYFISTATSFWIGVLGVLKAIIWPIYIVFGLLKFLGM